jgi:hypothetical protein
MSGVGEEGYFRSILICIPSRVPSKTIIEMKVRILYFSSHQNSFRADMCDNSTRILLCILANATPYSGIERLTFVAYE